MLKVQFYSCFPLLSLATASVSSHLCFSLQEKSHPLCQFIYVNIHTCMCMHAYIFLYVLALVFRTFSTSFLQDHLRRFLWVAYCQPRLPAWLLTARPLLFGFQFLFVFVLWAAFPVDSLACLLLGFYLPEMSNPLHHVLSIL